MRRRLHLGADKKSCSRDADEAHVQADTGAEPQMHLKDQFPERDRLGPANETSQKQLERLPVWRDASAQGSLQPLKNS